MGNSNYQIGSLTNPSNDADAVAKAFAELGFDEVLLRKDLKTEGMKVALREFARDVVGTDIAVIYFAGHGMEIGGENCLIPVDARIERAGDIELEAINLKTVLSQLEGARRLRLALLDACRRVQKVSVPIELKSNLLPDVQDPG
jgi:uncharacterized caspase-like protein